MHKLVISDDEGRTTVVPLVRDEVTIGRKEGNTIRLTERNVSRRHARLKRANGSFILEDLGSYNGIKINGRRIDKESTLKTGDQIVIGDYVLAFQSEATEGLASATTAEITVPTAADVQTAMMSAPTNGAAPAAAPSTPARLVMTSPPAPGAEYALSTQKVRIGRDEDLDICVVHRSISRNHAELMQEGE